MRIVASPSARHRGAERQAALDLRVVNGFDVRSRAAAAVASAWPRRAHVPTKAVPLTRTHTPNARMEVALRATRRGGAGSALARVGRVISSPRGSDGVSNGIRAGLLAGLGGATLVGYACAEQLVWYPR